MQILKLFTFRPMIRRLSTAPLRIRTIPILILAGMREWAWHWVPVLRGARIGEITGAIAIGAAATSILTTTTILIATIGTTTIDPGKEGIGQGKAIDPVKCRPTGNGDTIHRTAATHPTEIAGRRTNSVKMEIVGKAEIVDKPATGQAQVVEERNVRAAVHLQNQAAVEAGHQVNRAAEKDQRVDPAEEEAVAGVRVHQRGRPAAAAERMWATTPHREAITVEIAAAVTAAAAEIMRAPAVIAAVEVWAAADTAEVVADAVAEE